MRVLWLILGFAALVSGIIGIALPLWPSTPFLLLAAFAFSRGSERLHRWLHEHPWFGPPIRQWQEHRAVSRSSKVAGLALLVIAFISSLLFGVPWWALAAQLSILLPVSYFLVTRPEPPPRIGPNLMREDAFDHPVGELRLIETHLSWVILTGEVAYKIKKRIKLDFVDFSTLALRHQSCLDELEINRRFTPELYLDAVPVLGPEKAPRIGAPEDAASEQVIDWAVKMVQFDPALGLDALIAAGDPAVEALASYGGDLAQLHAELPIVQLAEGADYALQPMRDNFATLAGTRSGDAWQAEIDRFSERLLTDSKRFQQALAERLADGFVRECHGDLHLANLVATESGIRAFDALEFRRDLREIDLISDVAFLAMDTAERGRPDLAYGFLDAYFDHTGDYDGMQLLPLYTRYRAMVRIKVAALGSDQSLPGARESLGRRVQWLEQQLDRPRGRLILTCGLSGSGKSTIAASLAPRLGALRLRSDVLRKSLAGLAPQDSSGSGVDGGLYDPSNSSALYLSLAEHAAALMEEGEDVIVDAACLLREQRASLQSVADPGRCVVLFVDAPGATLRERVWQRQRSGNDASEATAAVLDAQVRRFEPPSGGGVIRIDTSSPVDAAAVAAAVDQVSAGQAATSQAS